MEPVQYFTNLALAAFVDGHIDPAELVLLEQHAENLRLTSEEAQSVLNRVASGELKDFVKPKSPEARQAAFRAVVRIIRADKKITRTEQRLIRVLGKTMEIDNAEVAKALSR
jgi:uncharacterized tellurite resistance protein B-like protein